MPQERKILPCDQRRPYDHNVYNTLCNANNAEFTEQLARFDKNLIKICIKLGQNFKGSMCAADHKKNFIERK